MGTLNISTLTVGTAVQGSIITYEGVFTVWAEGQQFQQTIVFQAVNNTTLSVVGNTLSFGLTGGITDTIVFSDHTFYVQNGLITYQETISGLYAVFPIVFPCEFTS